MIRLRNCFAAFALAGLLAGCQKRFDFARYTTNEDIFREGLVALNEGRSGAAIAAFDRLANTMSARDTLLPRTHYYLGMAYSQDKQPREASDAFRRIPALFQKDTLADDALLAAAKEVIKLWPNPELDSGAGQEAKDLLGSMLQNYPETPLREEAFRLLNQLDEAFAQKDLEVARQYHRQGAYPAAISYADQVIEKYPATERAKEARLFRIINYKKLNWQDDVEKHCKVAREMYRDDSAVLPEVLKICGRGPPPGSGDF